MINSNACFVYFNTIWGSPGRLVRTCTLAPTTPRQLRVIPVPGYTHMGIMESPVMQERILSEVE